GVERRRARRSTPIRKSSIARSAEEAAGHRPSVLLGLDPPGAVDRRLPELGRHQILELQLLLDAERKQLVGGLLGLEAPDRALSGGRKLTQKSGILLDILGDLRLDGHCLLVGRRRRIELGAGPGNRLIARQCLTERAWEQAPDLLVQAFDLELNALRLDHQLIDLAHRGGESLKLREIDRREVLRHILKHRGFVLERLYLIVDLVEGARRLNQVLGVIAGVEHGYLSGCRLERQGYRNTHGRRRDRRSAKQSMDRLHFTSPSRVAGKSPTSAAAQSSPCASRKAARKFSSPTSSRRRSIRRCEPGSEAPHRASAIGPRASSNNRLPRRDCR